MSNALGKRQWGEATPLPDTTWMKMGRNLNKWVTPVLGIFPADNPYGSFLERLIVGDSPERTQRMAEGYPHQYTGAGPNDPLIKPHVFDLAGALPIGTALKAGTLMREAGELTAGIMAATKGDKTTHHPLSNKSTNALSKPLEEMQYESVDTTEPLAELQERLIIRPDDLVGSALIPALGDRSDIGREIVSIGGNALSTPQRAYGGFKYMLENAHPDNSSVWANNKGATTGLQNTIQNALAQGLTPRFVSTPMGYDSMSFNTMTTNAMLEQMLSAPITKKAMKEFDRAVRKKRPEWKGINDPTSLELLATNGELRKAFVNTAGLEKFQKAGFPALDETKYAFTDQELLDVPNGWGGQYISTPTGELAVDPRYIHPSFADQFLGDYTGGLDQAIPPQYMYPDWYHNDRRARYKPENKDYRSLQSQSMYQVADEDWARGMNRYMGINDHGGFLPAPRQIGDVPLPGAPMPANVPTLGKVSIGPDPRMEQAAIRHSEATGIPYEPVERFKPIDPDFAARVAREYDLMEHNPNDPLVKEAYNALAKEVEGQYEQMLAAGIKPEFSNNPYPESPYLALQDMIENNKLEVYPTRDGYGPALGTDEAFDPAGNPLLAESPYEISGEPALYNDLFRAVHDAQGHGKIGAGFRAMGEEMAYQSHVGTLSPVAQRALAPETRGQNSWLNYGPHGESNRVAGIDATVFADQKTGRLPNWAVQQDTPAFERRKAQFMQLHEAGESGLEGAVDAEGNLILSHYAKEPIERVDPKHYGKGLSGQTRSERERAMDPAFVPRSYYGIEGDINPYRKEGGLGDYKVETKIQAAQVYDANADPDGIWKAAGGDATKAEKAVFDAGYSGYRANNEQLGQVAVIFDPLDVTKKLSVVLAAGIGALTANQLYQPEALEGI